MIGRIDVTLLCLLLVPLTGGIISKTVLVDAAAAAPSRVADWHWNRAGRVRRSRERRKRKIAERQGRQRQESAATEKDEELLSAVVVWIRKNGGFINAFVDVETINDHLTGLVASKDVPQGTSICKIPDTLVIQWERDTKYCRQMYHLYYLMTRPWAEQTPYERYLSTRTAKTHHHAPWFWTEPGKHLLSELMGSVWTKDKNNGIDFTNRLDAVRRSCWANVYPNGAQDMDQPTLNTLAVYEARHEENNTMVPFMDIINHGRGKAANAWVRHVQYEEPPTHPALRTAAGYYELFTVGDVRAGEQISISYEESDFADFFEQEGNGPSQEGTLQHEKNPTANATKSIIDDSFDTLHIFHRYGFVEDLPRTFHFLAKPESVAFTVHENQRVQILWKGGQHASNLANNKADWEALLEQVQAEVERLQQFQQDHENKRNVGATIHYEDIPANEWAMTWKVHDTTLSAMILLKGHLRVLLKDGVETVSTPNTSFNSSAVHGAPLKTGEVEKYAAPRERSVDQGASASV